MALTEQFAGEVLSDVRKYFKGQIKSNNKRYNIPFLSPEKQIFAISKQQRRNTSQKTAEKEIDLLRKEFVNKSLGLQAKLVIDRAQQEKPQVGNCYEMALAAAYYARERAHKGGVWISCIGAGSGYIGDHVFCLLSDEKGPLNCNSVLELASDDSGMSFYEGYFVVDPWLNKTCEAKDYYKEIRDRCDKWSVGFKEISWRGQWVDPGNTLYKNSLINGHLSFAYYP